MKKFIAVSISLVFVVLSVCSFSACKSSYHQIEFLIRSYRPEDMQFDDSYDMLDWFPANTWYTKTFDDEYFENIVIKFENLEHCGLNIEGFYLRNGNKEKKVVDKNGKVCDVKTLKKAVKKNYVTRLYAKTEIISFDLQIDYVGGKPVYRGNSVKENVQAEAQTVFSVGSNFSDYFPLLWKEGEHFAGYRRKDVNVPQERRTIGFSLWQPDEFPYLSGVTYSTYDHTQIYLPAFSYYGPADDETIQYWEAVYNNDSYRVLSLYSDNGTDWTEGQGWIVQPGQQFTEYNDYKPPITWLNTDDTVTRWSTEKTEYVPFDGTVNEDMQIYCKSFPVKTIWLNPMNGSSAYRLRLFENNISENIDESGFVLPDGYRFGGWYKTRDCEGEPVSVEENLKFSEVKHGATYYAKWIKA